MKAQVRQLSADLIPGDGWVTEHLAENGMRTVLPLVAWHVVNGELFPLPAPRDETWIVRPRSTGDDALINATALSMRLTPPTHQLDIRSIYPHE